MDDFSWAVGAAVFTAYCFLDWLWTIYTISIVERKGFRAANVGAGIYFLSAFGVINYVGDWRYVLPMCVGGWVGTYVSVWHQRLKDKRVASTNIDP